MQLGRKQNITDQRVWIRARAQAREVVSDQELDDLIGQAAGRISRELHRGRKLGYGWSGGKDSQVLRHVIERAGDVHSSVVGVTRDLEFPAMMTWIERHAPAHLHWYTAPLDLWWLARNPAMLFPATEPANTRWLKLVQHRAQHVHSQDQQLDAVLLGRRRKDGNWVGRGKDDSYTDRHGVTRWSPLADWTHEQLFACIDREHLPLPPCYDWPGGFYHGTGGAWASRQFTGSTEQGFADVWDIDPTVVRYAAAVLHQAQDWLIQTGRMV